MGTGEEGETALGLSLSSASALQEQACEKEKLHFPPPCSMHRLRQGGSRTPGGIPTTSPQEILELQGLEAAPRCSTGSPQGMEQLSAWPQGAEKGWRQ